MQKKKKQPPKKKRQQPAAPDSPSDIPPGTSPAPITPQVAAADAEQKKILRQLPRNQKLLDWERQQPGYGTGESEEGKRNRERNFYEENAAWQRELRRRQEEKDREERDKQETLELLRRIASGAADSKPEKPQQEPAPVPSVAVSAPTATAAASALTQELIQVKNTVYVVPQPARPTKKRKRKRKPTGPRVDEPAAASPAQSAADKAATEPESAVEEPQLPAPAPSRSELIDSKIEEVERETGRKINRKAFALVAGYNVRNLQLFQQGKATADVDRAFNRVLNLSAKTIVETLDRKTRH